MQTDSGWVDEDARRRKVLAERLAAELANAPGGRFGHGNDFVRASAVRTRLKGRVEIGIALSDARGAVATGPADWVGAVTGAGGTVMYVHCADLWSVVFPYQPFTGLILVCDDDLENGHCWQLDDDSPEAVALTENFRMVVGMALGTRRDLIERGSLPPDPYALPDPE